MVKIRDKVYDVVGNVKLYVECVMLDDKLCDDVMSVFMIVKELYNELFGGCGVVILVMCVVIDEDVCEKLKEVVEDLCNVVDWL